MTFLEAQEIVYKECDREKRITIRNLIIIALLVIVLLGVLYTYALPQIMAYFNNIHQEATSGIAKNYLKWVIPLVIFLTIFYPAKELYKVLKRKKDAEEVFAKIENGEKCTIIGEETRYLTTIPLYYIKLNLNPIHAISLYFSSAAKTYDLPIIESLSPQIKIILRGGNLEKSKAILNRIYGEDTKLDPNEAEVALPSLTAFETYSETAFTDELKALEGGRKKSKLFLYGSILVSVAFMVYMIVFADIKNNPKTIFIAMGAIFALSIVYYIYNMIKAKTQGNIAIGCDFSDIKNAILGRVVSFINPNFEYNRNSHIGYPEFMHSKLFIDKDYKLTGGDQVYGTHVGVPFQMCNLYVSYRPQLRNEKEADDSVFAGNYFVARFNKKFKSPIYIIPKKSFFANVKDNDISTYINDYGTKIRLEDPEFEKQFTVYCEDQVMVRYVLTPAMMERLKTVNTKSKGNLYIAINDQNIVLANNQTNQTAELDAPTAAMFTKMDQNLINTLFKDIVSNLEMVETLKLNINIWT
ncbi:DUF3137 domain-containing protein [Flavobacterium sp. PL002]|uniref:DUF3137 domain-containing protein n=1 Tax=Flavobacterium sp. PL002 TaxID=1897058 RepID=UPI0017885E86|nr:DUF3137 domain-containing protein [Flavobacterium sp. PL002]MBE0390817.1 hypothetical protein [Flavobacterium sp. PL002]